MNIKGDTFRQAVIHRARRTELRSLEKAHNKSRSLLIGGGMVVTIGASLQGTVELITHWGSLLGMMGGAIMSVCGVLLITQSMKRLLILDVVESLEDAGRLEA